MAAVDKIKLIADSASESLQNEKENFTPVTSLQKQNEVIKRPKAIVDYKDLAEKIKSNPRRVMNRKKMYKPPKKTCFKFLLRLLFSHIGLTIIVCCYTVFGAWLFIQIELPNENLTKNKKDGRALEINDTRNYLADVFWYWLDKNFTHDIWVKQVTGKLQNYEQYIIESVQQYQYDGHYGTWEYKWVFSNSLLYSVSLMSTIGYGHITPKTELGMTITILYAVIGIPLLLLFLASIGNMLAKAFKYTYSRICCRWCRSKRKMSEYQKGNTGIVVPRSYMRLEDENIGFEEYMPTKEVTVPILLNMAIIALYIVIGSIIFSYWEGWSLTTASYFTFITVSTTGLGDYIPGHSFLNYKDGFQASLRMIFTCLYCGFGMALVAMSITLMHEQVKAKLKWFAIEIGLIKSDEELQKEQLQTTP